MKQQGTFEKIDEFFEGKKQSEVYMYILMAVLIIVFLVWWFIFPMSKSYFLSKQRENKNITKKLNVEKQYLREKTVNGDDKYFVKQLNRQIQTEKQRLVAIQKTNTYIDEKLKELSYLLFNNKNWAKFLDSISEVASKYNVKIIKIANEVNEPDFQKVEQILNVHVNLLGSFHGVMNFINALEESMLIVDVYNIKLDGKKSIHSSIDIAVWGMKY